MVVGAVDIDGNGLQDVRFVSLRGIDHELTFFVRPFGFSGPNELLIGICPMSGSPGTVVQTGV